MRFGKSAEEAAAETPRGGDGKFIRYFKDGDTTLRILQEPDEWIEYWEHYNPGGYPFPCDGDNRDTCPGCTSKNEKMNRASKKYVFYALQAYNGKDYVNAWKVTPTLNEQLRNRFNRLGTLTDRDYTITKFEGTNGKTGYDLEGGQQGVVDTSEMDFPDIEELLTAAWEQAWGDGADTPEPEPKAEPAKSEIKVPNPPADAEPSYEEDDLRKMEPKELKVLCVQYFEKLPPGTANNSDKIVDWMMAQA